MQYTVLLLPVLAITASAQSTAFPSFAPVTCADYNQVPCGNSCMPPDAQCCSSNGIFCPAGEYCQNGGCCPNGEVCYGSASGVQTVTPSMAPSTLSTAFPSFVPSSFPTPSSTPGTCADYNQVPCGNSCMPPAAQCCSSNGIFCPAGEYCMNGGCCPNGEVCYGSASGVQTVTPTMAPTGMPSGHPMPRPNAAANLQHGLLGHGLALAAGLLAL